MSNVALSEVARHLDEYLRIRDVPDEPNALNGLQVENRSGRVGRIVAAVDAALATIEAVGRGEPGGPVLLLVHHGLFWDGNVPITGRRYRRVRALFERDIALYSAHIPLDLHPEVGNNAVLARGLGLREQSPFDLYRGVAIGVQGSFQPPLGREDLVARLAALLGAAARLIPGGPPESRRVGIITGAGGGRVAAAREAGLDTYITGEGAHHTYFDAMEVGVNLIFAGHYATETVGVKALAAHVSERFGLPWVFHDQPTGM
ncbi:MAG: Nif3-like dinuclear metal center hexameric protein [Gemmatimonadales bacterium]